MTTTTTAPATTAPAAPSPATGKAALLAALRANGIEASPRTLATWMETAANLCTTLAEYYKETEPQAHNTIHELEDVADEFRIMDV